ncbi:hypothetical protein [Oryzobacter terrae]|uniref:hypothetical protein n=1 Tax=Oryzobacter terrae TaxID=1620385 RepID=UPI00366A83ED
MSAHAYRLAILETDLLPNVLEPCLAFDDEILAEAAGLIAAGAGVDFGDYSLFDVPRPLVNVRSHAAVALLRVMDELAWARLGASVEYYTGDVITHMHRVIQTVPAASTLVGLDESLSQAPRGAAPEMSSVGDYLTGVPAMRETTSASEVVEAVRLLEFADEREWQMELARLDALTQVLRDGVVATLPLSSLDAVRWGLTGAETTMEYNRFEAQVPSRLLGSVSFANEREHDLTVVRRSLADAAVALTGDEVAQSSRRLARSIDEAREQAAGVVQSQVSPARQTATELVIGDVQAREVIPSKEEQRQWRQGMASD